MKEKTPKELARSLTKTEKDVLRLVCQHKSYKEIAEAFTLQEVTIRTHMSNIYLKLELKDLDRDQRILKIHNIYCPLLQEQPDQHQAALEIEIIEETPELDPISPEDEKMIDEDEMALVVYKQEPITGGKKKMEEKKKRGCGRFIFTLILGALMVIGAWYTWQNYLKDMPIVQSIVRLINPDAVVDSSSSAPSSVGSQPSQPSQSSQPSTAETIIQSILPKTNEYADAYEMDEWVQQDNVWIRLFDYEVRKGNVYFNFEIWNKTGQEIYFSWKPQDHFSLTDNKNNRYEIATTYDHKVIVANDERLHFTGQGYDTIQFKNDPIFESGVTDLYVTMEYLSKIDKAVFHVALGN